MLSILKIDIILKIHLITFLELFGLVVIKKMIKKLLSLLPILILVINAVKSDEESKNDSSIIELDSPKFYDTIVNNKHVLVEFCK